MGGKYKKNSALVSPLLWLQAAAFSHFLLVPYEGRSFFLKYPLSTLHTSSHLKNSPQAASSGKPSRHLPTAPALLLVTAIYLSTECLVPSAT